MKTHKLIAIFVVVFAALMLVRAASATTTPNVIFATPTWYSSYEHLAISYVVGYDSRCLPDEYGFYADLACNNMDQNVADWDVTVVETSPVHKPVYSERNTGYGGLDSARLYWHLDLGFPYCRGYRRSSYWYRAIVRLFSPIDGRVIASSSTSFGVRCVGK